MRDQKDNSVLPEITALAAGVILGGMFMVIGRFLFSSGTVPIYTNDWISTHYQWASLLVWIVSTLFAILWYVISLRWWKSFRGPDTRKAELIWFLLAVFPFLSLLVAVLLWGKDGDNSLEAFALTVLILILGLEIGASYWLSTALSTPRRMSHVIPLADLFRR